MPRIANLFLAVLVSLFVLIGVAALWQSSTRADMLTKRASRAQVSQASAHLHDTHRVIIRTPSGPPRIELAGTDPQGRRGSVACSTCHSVRQANIENTTAASLDEFHQGMQFHHGNITCYACHNPNESDALRLADGSSVAYENVMALCSQCHSKQADAFAHGAHGGMNGHWDLSLGPQLKNNCIDCHDPHVPKYPKMIVGFKPKDRFNEPLNAEHPQEGTAAYDEH